MDFLNLQTTEMRAPAFTGASVSERGTWLSLQLHCVAVENSGIIRDCLGWSAHQWLATIGIKASDIKGKATPLWHFEENDLHVWNYPHRSQSSVEAKREGGKKGGRPPKAPKETPPADNHMVSDTLNHPDNRKDKGKDKDKGKEKEGQGQGTAAPVVADLDQSPLRSDPDPEKKERGVAESGEWLDIASIDAKHLINESLGRDPRRAFTNAEEHTLSNFAQHSDGQVSTAQFRVLQRYLLAEPRFDSRNTAALDAVPEGSLLRKRKRYASNVIEDLPNQIDYAHQWLAEPQKKEGTGVTVSTVVIPEPDFWRDAWPMLFDFDPPPCWAAVLDMHKPQILAQIDQLKA
jgi:hypothetical protein